MRFMIFGAGYTAKAFALAFGGDVYGTTRTKENFKTLEAAGIKPLVFPAQTMDDRFLDALSSTTHLVLSIAPTESGDSVLNHCEILSHMTKLEWVCYLSTIGVYGDHQGAWIDEEANCHPSLQRNAMRLEVEKQWQDFAARRALPIALLRLGGIYGPSRNVFVKMKNGTARTIIKPGQVFNRIHVADIGAIIHAFARKKTTGIYNIVDNEPAPPQDIIRYAAKLMGKEPPAEIPFDKAEMSAMARSFYSDNKRILNHKLLKTGYHLKYPHYRAALDDMWTNNVWDRVEEC